MFIVTLGVSGLDRVFRMGEKTKTKKTKTKPDKTAATVQNDICARVSLLRNVAESQSGPHNSTTLSPVKAAKKPSHQ